MSQSKKHRSQTAMASHRHAAAGIGVSRRTLLIGAAVLAGGVALLAWTWLGSTEPARAETIKVWASPTCGCCTEWVAYMRRKGYRVTVNSVADTVPTKVGFGIPEALWSCHTSKVGDYIVEGLVPEPAIAKLLSEHPDLKGIALPGMPNGAPGMEMAGVSGVYRVFGFTARGTYPPLRRRQRLARLRQHPVLLTPVWIMRALP